MAHGTGTPRKGRGIYRIRLSDGGRAEPRRLVDSGAAAYRRRHARIPPLADGARDDGGRTGSGIAPVLETGVPAAGRVRRRCAGEGLEAAPGRRERRNRKPRSPGGGGGGRLVALACPQPPEGRSRWTMRLPADRPGGLETVDTVPDGTVGTALKKGTKPWLREYRCIPPKASGDLPAAMEDVLERHRREFAEDGVLAVMDGTSRQRRRETRAPRPVRPGDPAIHDSGYGRNGAANLSMPFAPLPGWREVTVTDRPAIPTSPSGPRIPWASVNRVSKTFPSRRTETARNPLDIIGWGPCRIPDGLTDGSWDDAVPEGPRQARAGRGAGGMFRRGRRSGGRAPVRPRGPPHGGVRDVPAEASVASAVRQGQPQGRHRPREPPDAVRDRGGALRRRLNTAGPREPPPASGPCPRGCGAAGCRGPAGFRRPLPDPGRRHRPFGPESVHRDHCRVASRSDGSKGHSNGMPAAVVRHPDRREVPPPAPEPVARTDGDRRNDRQRNAAARSVDDLRRGHRRLKAIVPQDGPASNGPHIARLRRKRLKRDVAHSP